MDFLSCEDEKILEKADMRNGKFDCVLMNPPYSGSLHLQFLDKAIRLSEKCVSIQPATFLINQRNTLKERNEYKPIKDKIENHVISCEIKKFNADLNIGIMTYIAIICIDMSKIYNKIDFKISNIHKQVLSIYDCNLIGDYQIIQSILKKCQDYGDMLKDHTTIKKLGNNLKYLKINRILTQNGYNSTTDIVNHKLGKYYGFYITPCLHKDDHTLYDYIPKTKANNPSICVYGTINELNNWIYYVLNNKLPLFLNCVLSIDQHNNSERYIPWIVDAKHTDNEIYKILDINKQEQLFIDETVEKFKYENDYFKKLM